MRYRKATVHIKGIRSLLFHAFSVDSIPLERQAKTGVAGNDPEEWRRSVMVTKENQLYLPPTYVFGCLRDGSKHTKVGKGSIMPKVAATLQVMDEKILINDRFLPAPMENLKTEDFSRDPTAQVYLDVRSVKNPTTKGRNVRYRVACSIGWELQFNIFWDATIVNEKLIESVINDAGALVGLGDARSIGCGRFGVVEFDVMKTDSFLNA